MNVIKKLEKFSFEKLKAAATSEDPVVRKNIFIEYFERFEEFPSYLFDNTEEIDKMFLQTIRDIENDVNTSELMHKGIVALMRRLPTPMDEVTLKAA